MGVTEFLWSFLPDQCEVYKCCRKGMRGNENIVYPWPERYSQVGIIMCDYCNSNYMKGEILFVEGNMPMIARGSGVILSFSEGQGRKKREKQI